MHYRLSRVARFRHGSSISIGQCIVRASYVPPSFVIFPHSFEIYTFIAVQLATYASPEFAITLYWHPSPYIIKGAVMRVPLHHIVWCRTLNSSLCIAICPCVLLEICGRHMYHGCSIRACHVSPYHHGQHVLQCIVIAGELLLFIYDRVSHMGIFRNILLCCIGWANHVVYPWPKSR